jgi:hypothetical protein
VTRAIKIQWDRGKETYLITSLPKEVLGASLVVKSYFDRWPDEELSFKIMKAVGCLHRVAGYGKQRLPDLRVRKRQRKLAAQIAKLQRALHEPMAAIAEVELEIANFIPEERRLRAKSRVVDGKRILPKKEAEEFRQLARRINALKRTVSTIRKEHPEFRKLDRAEREWIRLQGKDTVYKVDVELDQIMTFFRVSLVNLYTRMARLMGWSHLALVKFVHRVLLLSGRVEETSERRHVILEANKKDPKTMEALSATIAEINALEIRNAVGQQMSFALEAFPSKSM